MTPMLNANAAEQMMKMNAAATAAV